MLGEQLFRFRSPLRRRKATLATVGLFLSVFGSAVAVEPASGPGPFNVTIFHTNDTHSAFMSRPADWRDDGRQVGGVTALAGHLAEQRLSAPASLLVDAGDFMTGNPVCNLREDGVPGAAVARMMNGLGYDAGLIGNHEFDISQADLRRLVTLFDHPLLAADIVDDDGKPAFRREPVVIERGGLRVGIMGISCAEMVEVVAPSRFAGLHMVPQVPLLREQAAAIDPGTDLLVVLSHNGVDGDRALAAALEGSGIDVIVGGHSHSRLREPELVHGILIVQAGSAMTNLGRLDLRVEDDRVVGYAGSLINLWSEGVSADPSLTALVAGYEAMVQQEYGQRLGDLNDDLGRGRGEHPLGNWLADVLRTAAGADAALINSGGIRSNLSRGPLTALHINEVLPFANSLVVVPLTGTEIAVVADWNAAAQVSGSHGILQISGLSYAIETDTSGGPARAGGITIGGRPLEPEKLYRVAMPDFVAMMGSVYLGLPNPPFEDLGRNLAEVVVAAVKASGTVSAPPVGRIRSGAEAK